MLAADELLQDCRSGHSRPKQTRAMAKPSRHHEIQIRSAQAIDAFAEINRMQIHIHLIDRPVTRSHALSARSTMGNWVWAIKPERLPVWQLCFKLNAQIVRQWRQRQLYKISTIFCSGQNAFLAQCFNSCI